MTLFSTLYKSVRLVFHITCLVLVSFAGFQQIIQRQNSRFLNQTIDLNENV
jgi:hypothetical protein